MLGFILLFLPVSVFADSAPQMLGAVYYPENKSIASYHYEKRIVEIPGGHNTSVRYLDENGKILVDEEFSYTGDEVTQYIYQQNQIHEQGEIKIENNKVSFSYTRQGHTETDSAQKEPDTVATDMIPFILQKNWQALLNGESIKVRLLLVERLETVGFKFFKEKERDFQGVPAIDFRMKPSSFIIAALAPSITITMSKAPPHRLLETTGRLPIRVPEVPDPKTRKDWHAIDARMVLSYPQDIAKP